MTKIEYLKKCKENLEMANIMAEVNIIYYDRLLLTNQVKLPEQIQTLRTQIFINKESIPVNRDLIAIIDDMIKKEEKSA